MLKNKRYIILLIVVLILLLGGATYAWYVWNSSSEENINVSLTASSVITFDGGPDISGELEPVLTKEEGIIKEFSITSASFGDRFSLYMDIKSLPNEYKQTYFYWAIYNGNTLIESDDFHSYNTGDTDILLLDNVLISNGSTDTYTIYFWIDASVPNDSNIAGKTVELSIHATGTSGAVLEVPGSAAEYITNLYKKASKTKYSDSKYNITYNYAESVNLMNDRLASMDTDINAGNIRYYGANPDNYVSFNGDQTWRIIGVFNGRLKLIQNYIGGYSWDTSAYNVNYGYGVNQWGPSVHLGDDSAYDGADLMKLLNPGYSDNTDSICEVTLTSGRCGENDESLTSGLVNNSLYWNAGSGKCYTGRSYTASNCDFSASGLKDDTSKAMIDEATWNLGSNSKNDNPYDGNTTASRLYNWEHSDNSGIQCTLNSSYCSSDVRGTTTWVGKVGLMSPSDYAYATGGGTTHNINTCLSNQNAYVSDNSIQNWSNTYIDCKNNDWLFEYSWKWTITSRAFSTSSINVFSVDGTGESYGRYTNGAGMVRPVVFLNPNVKFIGGNGTSTNPYILNM